MAIPSRRTDLTLDLILPTLLFAAMGGMTWAVRGCSGSGASAGCIFAGVLWGAGWWYISQEPRGLQTRRYSSAWVILALTLGIGFSGARGWMQWPHFFDGRLYTNYGKGESVAISRFYGFLWMFIAGMPWAGLGACLLAWCGSLREVRWRGWILRIACGVGGAYLARFLFDTFPQYFLPLYSSMEAQYQDLAANPSLKRLINDSGNAIFHLGYYLGFLAFEIGRREWKNVVLILSVGLINGLGWALFQAWKWAPGVWKSANFNWWRCWESSGGISIGIALGIAYFLVNRRMSESEQAEFASRRSLSGPSFEWLGVWCGLAAYAGLFLREQTENWSAWYLTCLIVFAVVYYFANRGKQVPPTSLTGFAQSSSTKPSFDVMALVIPIATIVGLYLPNSIAGRYGMAYFGFVSLTSYGWYRSHRFRYDQERDLSAPASGDFNLERIGLYLGFLFGLGHSVRSGLKGWCNIYLGNEQYWNRLLWQILGPCYLLCLIGIALWVLWRPRHPATAIDRFPHAASLIWLTLIVQNVLGQLVTGPLSEWNEVVFSLYYLLLFAITAVIVIHYHTLKQQPDSNVTVPDITVPVGAAAT